MRRSTLLLAAALFLGVSACGDDGGETVGTTPTNPAPSGSTAPHMGEVSADLTVTVADGTGEEPMRWTLTCTPDGGDHPGVAAACAALATAVGGGKDPFADTPADQACTEQYGGPETATIAGTFNGSSVQASLSRTNGCEIARWDMIAPLLAGAPPGE